MHTLISNDNTTDSLHALAITKPGLVQRLASIDRTTLANLAANITTKELEHVTHQCSTFSSKLKSKMLEQRMILGAALHVLQQLHAGRGNGGFQRCLELANIERRNGYRCLALFLVFGPHCVESSELLSYFSIEAAQTLASKSTPPHIREHFIEQAKAGNDVTYRAVKHAIDSEKQRLLEQNPPEQPWLDRKLLDGDISIHCVVSKQPSRDQLEAAFQAAFKRAIDDLPPREMS